MTEIAWQLVAIAATVGSWDAFRRWVARDPKHVREMRDEIDKMERGWLAKFEHADRRCDRVEQGLQNVKPEFQPLGRHYTTRSPS